MAIEQQHPADGESSFELPIEELLRRARPLPPHEQMAIDEMTREEGEAFLAAVNS